MHPAAWPVVLACLLAACGDGETELLPGLAVDGQIMGTTYTVRVVSPPQDFGEGAMSTAVAGILEQVDQVMSTYRPESELSRFNESDSTDWFPVSQSLLDVAEEAARLAELTDGAMDVTVGPLVNLWGFGPDPQNHRVPDDAELQALREAVGFRHLSLQTAPPAMRKSRKDLYVDLSAIAKGYAVDGVADYLEAQGVESYMVEVGGELRIRGTNDRGQPWRIAVENPTPGARSVFQVITPGYNGMATSGDYRNFFEVNGRRYSHTIDPITGRPIEHMLASVSVVHPSAMTADGLATALMVMGPDRGLAFAERTGLPVFMIVKQGDDFVAKYSPSFSDYMADNDS